MTYNANAPTIPLEQLTWTQVGTSYPRARLLTHIRIGTLDLHLTAHEVVIEDGEQVAVDDVQKIYDLQLMEEVDFEPIEIEGLNYVLHALPFGR